MAARTTPARGSTPERRESRPRKRHLRKGAVLLMASRFTQYGGAAGAEQALREMVAERIAAQMEAEKVNQERYKLMQTDRQIGQGDARIAQAGQQFDARLDLDRDKFGQDQAEFEAGAPQREA